jgi:hypothetical protein
VALFDPFNRHYLRDVGAFQTGVGAATLMAMRCGDAVVVGLGGFLVADVAHLVSHVIDHGLGGRVTDISAIAVPALVAVAALIARSRRPSRTPTSVR